ncbi:uracil phosphoribosyltransferase [Sedimentibacter sp. zth1]|uniref:uracil phosphoribosyltransferase n=1 Tax=Sedimentibacter sp. zth1 TaxID=2816908 RepID=UPI001A93499A|nr:uracil phosphoribosyltransferase [Sedimentibacter sp. zth1]QSX06046.1 uracil phosphoribosyltransferase [Sedimentibacter sp. zth1]
MYENVTLITHPLIQHKVSILRDKNTTSKDFRELAREIAMLMAYEVTRNLPLQDKKVETPISPMVGKELAGYDLAIVPILRAGLGLVDGILDLIPNAKVGHIGLYRNEETLEPVEYYCKLPKDIENRTVIITEPMLATGGSMIGAVNLLKKHGVKNIKSMHLICSREGIKKLVEVHPDIEIYTPVIDEIINECGYIVPGLGDAGDRLFGTK